MPSTRSQVDTLESGLPYDYTDDEFDPDYRESSEEEEDEVPKTMQRDRAKWIEDNVEDIEFLYRQLMRDGRSMFGDSFLQTGTINTFANFLYRNTTPFSEA
ncbi:MAG: hypothetical protein CMO41_04415 [Verrucomicrobiales bacterium]|nr:hypothetical protein [Verrucomicrobiales bacterium]|tara:strand:+ start:150 stop:452 length:303 start_codon:yes stop_codon:yes gene_type:complete